jgi:hypothetical protein
MFMSLESVNDKWKENQKLITLTSINSELC